MIYPDFRFVRQVEFIEEAQAGEIPVMSFETPYDSGDGTLDAVSLSTSSD